MQEKSVLELSKSESETQPVSKEAALSSTNSRVFAEDVIQKIETQIKEEEELQNKDELGTIANFVGLGEESQAILERLSIQPEYDALNTEAKTFQAETIQKIKEVENETEKKSIQDVFVNTQDETKISENNFESIKSLSFNREQLDDILSNPEHTPKDLITLLEKDFKNTLDGDVGVWEKYTLREHTGMVLGQYKKYFNKSDIADKNLFELTLLLHDIGKPKAVADGKKNEQHEYTKKILIPILKHLDYSPKQILLAESIIDCDPIGEYLKGDDVSNTAKTIVETAKKTGLQTQEFFSLVKTYYQVDAGSYTKDAGGKESLDHIFSFNSRKGIISFASDSEKKMKMLEKEINRVSQENVINTKNNFDGKKNESPSNALILAKQEALSIVIRPEDVSPEGKLLATPGGAESFLSEENWKLVRTESFKKWFGDSNVVDENGEPALVFHTTNADMETFDSFSRDKNKKETHVGAGHYFTSTHDDDKSQYGKNRLSVFLNAKLKDVDYYDILSMQKNREESVKKWDIQVYYIHMMARRKTLKIRKKNLEGILHLGVLATKFSLH